jgi:hypothetical protein
MLLELEKRRSPRALLLRRHAAGRGIEPELIFVSQERRVFDSRATI